MDINDYIATVQIRNLKYKITIKVIVVLQKIG